LTVPLRFPYAQATILLPFVNNSVFDKIMPQPKRDAGGVVKPHRL
jgi:hypothetical protein